MKRRRIWSDTDRIAVGEEHRDAVIDLAGDDITKPTELIEADAAHPMTNADGIRLWDRVDRLKIELGIKPGARLNSLDFKMKIVWGLLGFALMAAGASLTKVIDYIGDSRETALTIRGLQEKNTDFSNRLRSAEDTVTRSAQRLDDLQQRMNK